MVDKIALVDKLEKERDVTRVEAEKLITQLDKEGTIYSPKAGYLKKT